VDYSSGGVSLKVADRVEITRRKEREL